ncbi:MAG: hypothetical protein J5I53_02495 [Bradyrhizobiaceae bacterium]|nr:hypothetical protein [Bradyrhizobiaceae bacterium]
MRKHCFTWLSIACILTATHSQAQPATSDHTLDHVFAAAGGSKLTIATGIPYLGVFEYAYGLSEDVTAGILYGQTPSVEGYGVRVRGVLFRDSLMFRIYLCVPVLYYPQTKELGGDAWWLTRPNINFEWITKSGFRYKVGASVIAAASQYWVGGEAWKAKFNPGVWNAFHAGVSLPVGCGIMFQSELSAVMNGVTLAGKDWVGGPPVILITGFSYEL